jgi:hypothetical protein
MISLAVDANLVLLPALVATLLQMFALHPNAPSPFALKDQVPSKPCRAECPDD